MTSRSWAQSMEYRIRPNGDKIAVLLAEDFDALTERVAELETALEKIVALELSKYDNGVDADFIARHALTDVKGNRAQ